MSYNIDTCRIKRMENFIIPLDSLYKTVREDYKPKKPILVSDDYDDGMEVQIQMGCGQTIVGVLKNNMLHVTEMDITGEGSGSLMNMVLNPAFTDSKGIFEALMVWEGGDTIANYSVIDGVITEESV